MVRPNMYRIACPTCNGTIIFRLDSFPTNSLPGNQKFHLKCPLCGNGFFVGYVVESHEATVAREAQKVTEAIKRAPDDLALDQQAASSDIDRSTTESISEVGRPETLPEDGRDDGGDEENVDRSPNDDRSDSMNPNNAAY